MGTLNLAAASLGAAAPVPSAQDAPSKTAPGFADVLAGVTDSGSPADAAASGSARHARAGKGQPAWAALEQLARQLALSAGAPIPGAGDPKAAKAAAEGGADEPAEPEGDADAAAPTALLGGAVPTPVVPAARLQVADDAVGSTAATERTDLGHAERLALDVDRGATQGIPAAPGESVTSEAAGHRRADPAGRDIPEEFEQAVGADITESARTSARGPQGLALGAGPSPASTTDQTPPSRSHRADVEAFREWAATAARAQSPFADGAGAPPAAASSETAPHAPANVAADLTGAIGDQSVGGNTTAGVGERGRTIRRATEAGRALVERFKANESPVDAAPQTGTRIGARTVEVGTTPSGDKPRSTVAPQARVELPALPGQATVTRTTTPIASEAPAPLTSEGGLESQIVQAVKVQWGRDGGEARIRLQPHYLGELMISLRVEQGGVTAHLIASAPEVRQWIESNEAVLRQSLAQHDLTLERLIVTEEEPSAGTSEEDPRQPDPRRQAKRHGRRGDRDATFEVVV